jgi:hypothetical protein
MWSLSKHQEAKHLYNVVQRLDIEEKLRKADNRELTAAKKLVKEKEKEQRRVAHKAAAKVQRKEKEEHTKGVAERKAKRERLKQEHNTTKAIQLSQKGKRKASQAIRSTKRQKRVYTNNVVSTAPLPTPPSPLHKTTTRSHNIKLPAKFK